MSPPRSDFDSDGTEGGAARSRPRLMRPGGFPGRLPAIDPRLVDGLIALALAALIAVQFAWGDQPGPEADVVNLITGPMLALPLAWRRRAPLAMICAFALIAVTNEALGGGIFSFPDGEGGDSAHPPIASLLTGAVAFYSLGAYADERRAAIGVAFGLVALWVTVFVSAQVDFGSFFFSTMLAVAPWLVGRNFRARNLRLAAAQREQEQRARLAASNERARIAREFHDVVAHSVGVIVVQAEGARRVLERDPERAREALESIERTGRKALAEMRRSLGVLRLENGDAALEPQPGLNDLDALVRQARQSGLTVEVTVEGERRTLPQGVDLSAYRIVQEALTNTIKHAGQVPTRIAVRYGEDQLELEISDDGPGPPGEADDRGSGHGLVGMRERAALYGGELRAGPRPEGGFVVRARIPLTT
jgi:signal transduction histidine kinase